MARKAMTMILAALLLGGAATIPTMALARGGSHAGGSHFGGGDHYGGRFGGGFRHYGYGGFRHYGFAGYRRDFGYGGYWDGAYASCYPYRETRYCY
jgi:hypothetical protein